MLEKHFIVKKYVCVRVRACVRACVCVCVCICVRMGKGVGRITQMPSLLISGGRYSEGSAQD